MISLNDIYPDDLEKLIDEDIAIIDENGAFLSISQETFNIEIESFSSKWQGDLIAIPK